MNKRRLNINASLKVAVLFISVLQKPFLILKTDAIRPFLSVSQRRRLTLRRN